MGKGKNGSAKKGLTIEGKSKAERYKTRRTYHRPTSPIRSRLEELREEELASEALEDWEDLNEY